MSAGRKYIGLDVHQETVAIALADEGDDREVRYFGTVANRPEALHAALKKIAQGGFELCVCYESGPCGLSSIAISGKSGLTVPSYRHLRCRAGRAIGSRPTARMPRCWPVSCAPENSLPSGFPMRRMRRFGTSCVRADRPRQTFPPQKRRWMGTGTGAGVEDGEECDKEIEPGREHQGDPIARRDTASDECAGKPARSPAEVSMGKGTEGGGLVLQHGKVQPLWMQRFVPLQRLDQCTCLGRSGDGRKDGGQASAGSASFARRSGPVQRPHKIGHGFGFGHSRVGSFIWKARSIRNANLVRPRLSMPRSRSILLDGATSIERGCCGCNSRRNSVTIAIRSRAPRSCPSTAAGEIGCPVSFEMENYNSAL
ncbi:hypothetical protein ILFOPFJJ_05670 [Ensifer psoraleae]|nr:hypothetical protein [Sinorhizobium psoraleae]